MKVLSLYDRTAGVYGRPFFVASVGVGVRDLTDEVRRVADDNMLSKHPSDFDLYELGDFDERLGLFSTLTSPGLVLNCSALVFVGSVATAAPSAS